MRAPEGELFNWYNLRSFKDVSISGPNSEIQSFDLLNVDVSHVILEVPFSLLHSSMEGAYIVPWKGLIVNIVGGRLVSQTVHYYCINII